MVHLRTDTMAAEKRVDTECEIECRAVGRHRLELPFGRNYEDFRGVEVQLDGIEEVQGVRLWVVQDFFDGVEPFFQFVFAVCCRLLPSLYFQWAANPCSAISSILVERICTSIHWPVLLMSVTCRAW